MRLLATEAVPTGYLCGMVNALAVLDVNASKTAVFLQVGLIWILAFVDECPLGFYFWMICCACSLFYDQATG